MLSISQQLPAVILSGSPAIIKAEETDIYLSQGNIISASIIFKQQYDVGDYVSIEWNGKTETFTAVSAITQPGNQVLGNDANPLALEYWGKAFVDMLKQNARLMHDFSLQYTFTNNTYYIILTPYIKTADFNSTWSENSANPANLLQNGSIEETVYNQNQKILFQLYKETELSSYKEFSKYREAVGVNIVLENNVAKASYDVSRIIIEEQFNHFTIAPGDNHIEHDIVINFTPYIYSIWGTPPIKQNGLFGTVVRAINGALSEVQLATLNTEGKSFYQKLIDDKMFLTFSPSEKTTDIYTPERLYYLSQKSQTIYLRVVYYFANQTTETVNLDSFVADAWKVYELAVGFFDVISDKTNVVKYEVYLRNNFGELLTQTRSYIIDYNYYKTARYFAFLSRLGFYELVRFTGNAKKQVITEKSTVELIKNPERKLNTISRKQVSKKVANAISINTGYLRKEFINFLAEEIPVSEHILWLKQGKTYNVDAEAISPVVSEDNNDLPNFNITFTTDELSDVFYDEFGIELPVAGDFNEDFNEDFYDN